MHSFLIISEPDKAMSIASSHAPYALIESIDNFIVNSEEKIGIDNVREIKKFLQTKPYKNTHKIIFISNADQLTTQAQNSLLKTLEEPPENSLIFLATSNIDKLLPTVISRCQVIKDDRVPTANKQGSAFADLVLSKLNNMNQGQKISLAGEYAYPKTKSVSVCIDAIHHFRSSLYKNPSINISSNLKLASTTLKRLESNVDPRLSLEYFFLNILV